jgi:methionine-rich copper-binding protein CopC
LIIAMKNRKTVLAALAAAGILGAAGIAGAHAHLQTAAPRANSVVTQVPSSLDLQMTEGVKSVQVDVLDVNGESVAAGQAIIDPANNTHVTVPLKPGLPQGTYTVKWQATAEDGHVSTGRYQFTVAAPGQPGLVRIFWNGKEIKGDVPATIINGRTMVPVRALAEALGKAVEWDANQRFVIVNEAPAGHSHHETYKHPAGTPAPTLKLTVTPDAKSGFNIKLETTNWTWTPDQVGTAATPNTGHGHLYVDGVKVARLYGPWYHLEKLTPGQHDIRVTLNANDHADYATEDGHVIEAKVSVVQKADGTGAAQDDHAHGDMHHDDHAHDSSTGH